MTPRGCRRTIPQVLALATVLLGGALVSRADPPPGAEAAIAAEVAAALPPAPHDTTPIAVAARPRFWLAGLVDHLDLRNRIHSLQLLKFVHVWDSRRFSVYFGLDRHGLPGLHIARQDPSYSASVRMAEPPDVIPPLRAVPLNAL